jgi:hypothetical protein
VLIDKDHIDFTYRLVCAAKDGVIWANKIKVLRGLK